MGIRPELWEVAASLGVPGVALLVMYLLLRRFGFRFDIIPPLLSALIAVLFIMVIGAVTLYALHRFDPNDRNSIDRDQVQYVSHEGKLSNLELNVNDRSLQNEIFIDIRDPELARLRVMPIRAKNWSSLIERICRQYECLECSPSDGNGTLTYSLALSEGGCVKEIGQEEGDPVHGCSTDC